MKEYQLRAHECIVEFDAHNEFYLNKLHRLISKRAMDYLFILIQFNQHVFAEFNTILHTFIKKPDKKLSKKDVATHILRTSQINTGLSA